jgi:hypothetical protein
MAAACLLYLSNVPCPACGKPFHATSDAGDAHKKYLHLIVLQLRSKAQVGR